MKKKLAAIAAIGLLCALATGCGGGSDDSSSGQPPAPALNPQGFWSGTTSDGATINLIVLETGETYGYYASNSHMSSGIIDGAVFGDMAFSNTQLSGSWLDFNFYTQIVKSYSHTGNFAPQNSLTLRFPSGVAYTATYGSGYDQPQAPLSTVAGNYSSGMGAIGRMNFASTASLPVSASAVVSASGAITLSPIRGCSANGTIQPRASGKNIYDVVLNLQGSGCMLLDSAALRGIAMYAPGSGTSVGGALLIEARDAAKTGGLFFLAGK